MRIYLRILSLLMLGAIMVDGNAALATEMPWFRAWSVILATLDIVAAVGLWLRRGWGANTFIFLNFLELVVYCLFATAFADTGIRIGVLIATMLGYLMVAYKESSQEFKTPTRKSAKQS